jgi:DNA-binding transcriptional MerR regulator
MSSKNDLNPVSDIARILNLEIDFTPIPDKLEFRIGEVGDLLAIKTYVLRFWEMEFEGLKPFKGRNKQRVYKRRDVQISFLIKHLLYEKRYSIEGARAAIKQAKADLRVEAELNVIVEPQTEVRDSTRNLELTAFVARSAIRHKNTQALAKLYAVIEDVKSLNQFLEQY